MSQSFTLGKCEVQMISQRSNGIQTGDNAISKVANLKVSANVIVVIMSICNMEDILF